MTNGSIFVDVRREQMNMETIGRCYICGSPLEWDEDKVNCFTEDYMGDEGDTMKKEMRCMECGTYYENYITKDEVHEPVSCNDQGFGNCIHCGGTLIWSGDFMRSDFDGDERSDKDDAIVRSLVCANCGCSVEVWEPTENEMKKGTYPYWKEEED